MPRKRDPVPRARTAWHWLGGILLLGVLGGAMVAAAVMLWESLDIRQLAPTVQTTNETRPLPVPEEPPAPAVPARPFTALLLNSPRNRSFFPDSTHYPRALDRWRGLIESVGGQVRVIGSLEEVGQGAQEELLVVPEAPCLSALDRGSIRRHLQSGGSLVTNWAVGARDQDCRWRGWETVAELTDADDVREIGLREALYITVPAGTPFSPGLDPGTRIEFLSAPALAIRAEGPRVYWADWALNSAPDESGGGADAAAGTSMASGGGRTVWFGFQLSHVASAMDSTRLARVVENGIRWAAGIPAASVAPWPGGKRAAMVFSQDVEAEFRNAEALASVLVEKGVPGTFFAVSRLVGEDPELASALLAAGEVGSHTSDHAPLAGLDAADQRLRLRRAWSETREWTGVEPAGLRPPEETFDTATLQAWLDAGGEYLMAVSQARSGSPEIYRLGRGSVVVLPRLMKDDYNVFVQDGAMRSHHLTEAFLGGADKIRSLGGFAALAVHTQIVGTGSRLDAIRVMADTARAQGDWWIARGGEVAAWWKQRSRVGLTFQGPAGDELAEDPGQDPEDPGQETRQDPGQDPEDPEGASRQGPGQDEVTLLVEAPGDQGIRGLWVDILLPSGLQELSPLVAGVPVSFVTTGFGIRVPVGDMEAGETREISLRRTDVPGPPRADTAGPADQYHGSETFR